VGGSLLTALTFFVLLFLPVDFTYWEFALIIAFNGFGSGLFASPNRAEMMNAVPANQRGAAGGMIATFMNTSFVLSIGVFFSLMVAGLSSKLPGALSGGLVAQGIPASAAAQISHLPPIGVLFAAFLGYNPMQQLLGPLLGHLPAGHPGPGEMASHLRLRSPSARTPADPAGPFSGPVPVPLGAEPGREPPGRHGDGHPIMASGRYPAGEGRVNTFASHPGARSILTSA